MQKLSVLSLALALSLTAGAAAQSITLLGDQNPTPNPVNPASQGRAGAADTSTAASIMNSRPIRAFTMHPL